MTVGEKIKLFRKTNKLTQQELGDKVGVSAISIRKYESGDRIPSNTTLKVLSNIFNISVDELTDENKTISFGSIMAHARNLGVSPNFLIGKTSESDLDFSNLEMMLSDIQYEKIKNSIEPLSTEKQKELSRHLVEYLKIVSELTYTNEPTLLTIDVITLYSLIIKQIDLFRDELHFNKMGYNNTLDNAIKLSDLKKESLINIGSLLDKIQALYTTQNNSPANENK